MTSVIAHQGRAAYFVGMPRLVLRMFAIVAVLLMPAGMAAAPAFAQPAATGEEGHCGDHEQPTQETGKSQLHCMACGALPALPTSAEAAALLPKPPKVIARTRAISGIVLEIATPPPKLS